MEIVGNQQLMLVLLFCLVSTILKTPTTRGKCTFCMPVFLSLCLSVYSPQAPGNLPGNLLRFLVGSPVTRDSTNTLQIPLFLLLFVPSDYCSRNSSSDSQGTMPTSLMSASLNTTPSLCYQTTMLAAWTRLNLHLNWRNHHRPLRR